MTRQLLALVAAAAIGLAATARAADTGDESSSAQPAGLSAARARIYAHDYKDAIPILVKVIKKTPNNADALNLMGYSLRMTGDTKGALQYYDRALALKPRHLGANEYLGELYVELGQLDKAKERLAVLEAACGSKCIETRELRTAIARGEKRQQQSRR
jgi:tetratricopeptide (TPR) repeat protein